MDYEEQTGPLWTPRVKATKDAYKHKPTLEGLYFWMMSNCIEDEQIKALKYAIGRLARQYPDLNPREVILEYFSDLIYAYERDLQEWKDGTKTKRAAFEAESSRALISVLNDRLDFVRGHSPGGEQPLERPEEKAIQGEGRREVAPTDHRWISISPQLRGEAEAD